MMTDDELLKAVLEKLGWTGVFQNEDGVWEGYAPYPTPPPTMSYDDWFTAGPGNYLTACPDYLHDRNAMAELVGGLTGDQLKNYGEYLATLLTIDGQTIDAMRQSAFRGGIIALIVTAPPAQQLRAWWWEVMKDE